MRRRDVLTSALVASAAAGGVAPAAQAAPPKKGKDEAAGQFVELTPFALPVLDGPRLRNYVFLSVRLNLTPRAEVQKWREKEPYFRDAIVRAAHRTALNPPDDWNRLDEARVKAALMTEVRRIAGAGVVASISIKSQTPQRRVPPPRRAA